VSALFFLDREGYLTGARVAVGGPVQVHDEGSLDSALARPRASAGGMDAYDDFYEKAGALLQSLACNHPLVDGNKRAALMATLLFLRVNGVDVKALDEDGAVEFVLQVATSQVTSVKVIAARLHALVGADLLDD
jgi:death-on-curing protein